MNILKKWKNKLINTKTINAAQFPVEIWEHIISFLPDNDVIALSSTSSRLQRIVHTVKPSFYLERNYHLNLDCLLNYALSTSCTSLNIDNCYWLEPSQILEIISRTKLQQFYLINCNVNEDVARAIFNLHLHTFSFSFNEIWAGYFIEHREESSVFFQRLLRLKATINYGLWRNQYIYIFLLDISSNVFQYCEQLEDLILMDYRPENSIYYTTPPLAIYSTSLMPKLKYLTIDMKYYCGTPTIVENSVEFLKAILKDKVIPLELVNFGPFNCHLLKEGISHHPLILPEKIALLLSNFDSSYFNLIDILDDDALMCQTSYKHIILDTIEIEKFVDFADKIVSNCGKSIKTLYLKNCQVSENILSGIQLFALISVQITVLDLTIVNWLEEIDAIRPDCRGYYFSAPTEIKCYSYSGVESEKNQVLLEVLTNFKNLQKLSMSPLMLHCLYHSPHDSKVTIKEMPFWKVTKACERLRELYITRLPEHPYTSLIHEKSLYDIEHCKNLKGLHLENFCIRTNADFLLSTITKSCPQLEELTIDWQYVLRDLRLTQPTLDNTFNLLKNLRKLRCGRYLPIRSTTVIDNLSRCKYLENLYLSVDDDDAIHSLTTSLPNFKNLYVFVIYNEKNKKAGEQLDSIILKIRVTKPAFVSSVYNFGFPSTNEQRKQMPWDRIFNAFGFSKKLKKS